MTVKELLKFSQDWCYQIKSHGEKISELQKVEKILRDHSAKYDHIIVAIEESKYLSKMKLEKLQSSLESHELRIK